MTYMRARYYNAGQQRFVSRDLLPSENRYIYASNAPSHFVDPSGRFAIADDVIYILIGLGIAGTAVAKCLADPACRGAIADAAKLGADAIRDVLNRFFPPKIPIANCRLTASIERYTGSWLCEYECDYVAQPGKYTFQVYVSGCGCPSWPSKIPSTHILQ